MRIKDGIVNCLIFSTYHTIAQVIVVICFDHSYYHALAGYVESKVVYYLMNIHVTSRSIYLTRVSQFPIRIESKSKKI